MNRCLVGLLHFHRSQFLTRTCKLGVLWFDELVIETPFGSDATVPYIEMMLNAVREHYKLNGETLTELIRLCRYVQDFVPDYTLSRSTTGSDEGVKEYSSFIELARTAIQTEREREGVASDNIAKELMDVHDLTMQAMNTFCLWRTLNERDRFSLLGNQVDRTVLHASLSSRADTSKGHAYLEEVLNATIPDLSDVSWDKIMELRHHPHLESFRSKLNEISSAAESGDQKGVATLLREVELNDLRSLARLTRPAPLTICIKSAGALVPLIHAAILGKELYEAHEISERYGWLYFLQDLRDSSSLDS